jgi:hypothetical protein
MQIGQSERATLTKLRDAVAAGLAANTLQRIPHLVLLSDAFYSHTMRPVLTEWLLLWLRRQGLRDISEEQATNCLVGGASDAQVQATLSDRHIKILLMTTH